MSSENPYSPVPAVLVNSNDTEVGAQQPSNEASSQNCPIVFDLGYSASKGVILPAVGAGLAFGFGMLMFLVNLFFIDAGQFAFHSTTTLPMIGGVFLFMTAMANRSAARQIRLWPNGIEIIRNSTEAIPWEQVFNVRLADSTNPGTPNQKTITLCGANNEPITQIRGVIQEPNLIVDCIKQFANIGAVSENSTPVVSKSGKRKGRRSALLTGCGSILLLAAGVFIPIDSYQKEQMRKMLETEAVPSTGIVTETFIAPNGRTLRIKYDVVGSNGVTASHNVEVTPEFYEQVAAGNQIDVEIIADEPSISRLLQGQVIEQNDLMENPIIGYVLGAFGLLAACFMLPVAVVQWKGYDINFNNGKFKLVPLD